MILIYSTILFLRKPVEEIVQKENNIRTTKPKYQRYLSEEDEYDSYMVLYFKEDCNYTKGFKREKVSYIINRKDNSKISNEDKLNIEKDYPIEIHFAQPVDDLFIFFSYMYDNNMEYLLSVDLSNFDASSVTDMQNMLDSCFSLESIDLSVLNLNSLKYAADMFYNCTSLKSVDLSNLNMPNLELINSMFYDCISLKVANLSGVNAPKLRNMGYIFFVCT